MMPERFIFAKLLHVPNVLCLLHVISDTPGKKTDISSYGCIEEALK